MRTIDQVLKVVAPKADPRFVAASARVAVPIMERWGFTGAAEQAQIVGQMAHESMGFTRFEESLSYSAKRLTQVWPRRYPTEAAAAPFAKNPKALAISVYGGRMGNRPGTDDGWTFRGSDPLQHTGRSEFGRVTTRTGVDVLSNPDRLRDPSDASTAWQAACSFFVDRSALPLAKAGDTRGVTVKVNGGTNGLSDREILVARVSKVLAGEPLRSAPSPVAAPPPPVPATETAAPPAAEQRTTAEVADDEKKKRDRAIAGTATAAPSAGGGTSQVTDQTDWVLVGGVVLAVLLVGFVVVRYFWRRHAEAQAAVEAQQIRGIAQRAEGAAP